MPSDRLPCAAPAADVAPASPQHGEDARLPPPPEPVVIDGGDRACVALLLELRRRICDLPAGTVIHLIASDPAALPDLPAWHLTGHAYLGSIPAVSPTYALRTTPPLPLPTPPLPGGGVPDQDARGTFRRQLADSDAGVDPRSVEGHGADNRRGKRRRGCRRCG